MPLEEALPLISKVCGYSKSVHRQDLNTYLGSLRSGSDQPSIKFLVNLLVENKHLGAVELDRLVDHLKARRVGAAGDRPEESCPGVNSSTQPPSYRHAQPPPSTGAMYSATMAPTAGSPTRTPVDAPGGQAPSLVTQALKDLLNSSALNALVKKPGEAGTSEHAPPAGSPAPPIPRAAYNMPPPGGGRLAEVTQATPYDSQRSYYPPQPAYYGRGSHQGGQQEYSQGRGGNRGGRGATYRGAYQQPHHY